MFTTRHLATVFAVALTTAVVGCAQTGGMSTSAGVRERPLSACDDLPNADQRAWCIAKEKEDEMLPDTE